MSTKNNNYLKLLEFTGVKKLLLYPFSFLWDYLHRLRRILFEYGFLKREFFKIPIISVGNISFGGTGKTPTILWLIEYLNKLDLNIVVLTRGFKGELENSFGIIKAGQTFRSNPYEFGDEPILIAKKIKKGALIVGKNRSANLKKSFHDIQPDVVLLDDGFQHLKLHRSLNIVLFDASMPISYYETAPLGYLRESLTALKYADIIVISRADQVGKTDLRALNYLINQHKNHDTPVMSMKYSPMGLYNMIDEMKFSKESMKDLKVIALSAIGSPESFHNLLLDYGVNLIKKVTNEDHHYFTLEEITQLIEEAKAENAFIIITEKDMVKIKRLTQNDLVLYMPVSIEFMNGYDIFSNEIKRVLKME